MEAKVNDDTLCPDCVDEYYKIHSITQQINGILIEGSEYQDMAEDPSLIKYCEKHIKLEAN